MNGIIFKNSKNGSVDGQDLQNEKQDELKEDLQAKISRINAKERVTTKNYFENTSPQEQLIEKDFLVGPQKSGSKEKRAFVIEVDDLHDVETINNLLEDPVTNLLQQNSDIVFLNTQNNLFNVELPSF